MLEILLDQRNATGCGFGKYIHGVLIAWMGGMTEDGRVFSSRKKWNRESRRPIRDI